MSFRANAGRDPDMPRAEATGTHPMGAGETPFCFMPYGKVDAHMRGRGTGDRSTCVIGCGLPGGSMLADV